MFNWKLTTRAMPLVTVMLLLLVGCAATERSVIALEMPRINVHTFMSPDQLAATLVCTGCEVRNKDGARVFVLSGTGQVSAARITISVRTDSAEINGRVVSSDPDRHRNVVVSNDGAIREDCSISWEG